MVIIIRTILASLALVAAVLTVGGRMEIGIGIAVAGVTIAAGQVMAEAMQRRRSNRIADLEAKVADLTKKLERAEANLANARSWLVWAQKNLVTQTGAPMMSLPLLLE